MTIIEKDKMRLANTVYLDWSYIENPFWSRFVNSAINSIEEGNPKKDKLKELINYSLTDEDKYSILEQIMIAFETQDYDDIFDVDLIISSLEAWIIDKFDVQVDGYFY